MKSYFATSVQNICCVSLQVCMQSLFCDFIHCIPRSAEMAALTKLATPPMKKPTTAIRIPFMVNVWLKSESVKKTIIINHSRKIGMMKCIKSYANLTPGSSLFLNKIIKNKRLMGYIAHQRKQFKSLYHNVH